MKTGFPLPPAGEIIDVIAPASACSAKQLSAGLALLRSWGYVPRVPAELFGCPGILANEDPVRLQHLHTALQAPDSRLIWAVRGGYGCLRLLPGLEALPVTGTQKILLGYSDVTILQHQLMERFAWPMLHTQMFSQLAADGNHGNELRQLLAGQIRELHYGSLQPENDAARDAGLRVIAPLRGGNLTSLVSLSGTPWAGITLPHILVLEEVDERGYEIDRLLTQLRLSGWLQNTRALILGQFCGGEEADGCNLVAGVLREFAQTIQVPVFSGLPVGHADPFRPLPLGIPANLYVMQGLGQLSIQWA